MWEDLLRPASFRGVGFRAEGITAGHGRRGVDHEFPGRDRPFAEDLGRKARSYRLRAYVLGDDALGQRDRLIAACEAHGPGVLVHPSLGEVSVVCRGCDVLEGESERRIVRFTLSFVESGERIEPSARRDTQTALLDAVDSAIETLVAAWRLALRLARLPDHVMAVLHDLAMEALATLDALIPRAISVQAAARLGALLDDIAGRLGQRLIDGTIVDDLFAAARAFGAAVEPALATARLPQLLAIPGPASLATRADRALDTLVSAVRGAGLMEIARASAALTWSSQGAAAAHRDRMRGLFDAAADRAAARFDDGAFEAIGRVGNALVADATARGASLAPLAPWSTPRPLPALVAAHGRYGDAGREAEMLAELGARHPLFLPVAGQVLAR